MAKTFELNRKVLLRAKLGVCDKYYLEYKIEPKNWWEKHFVSKTSSWHYLYYYPDHVYSNSEPQAYWFYVNCSINEDVKTYLNQWRNKIKTVEDLYKHFGENNANYDKYCKEYNDFWAERKTIVE